MTAETKIPDTGGDGDETPGDGKISIALQFSDIVRSIYSISKDIHTINKELMKLHIEHEALARSNTDDNRNRHEVHRNDADNRDKRPPIGPGPPADGAPHIRMDAPRFSGDDPQLRFNDIDFFNTLYADRLFMVIMLIEHSHSDWFSYYTMKNEEATWDEFLTAFRHHFDPQHFKNYLGLFDIIPSCFRSNPHQYHRGLRLHVHCLVYLGLQRQLKLKNPSTLDEVFALAHELATCHEEAAAAYAAPQRLVWQNRSLTTTAQPQ